MISLVQASCVDVHIQVAKDRRHLTNGARQALMVCVLMMYKKPLKMALE